MCQCRREESELWLSQAQVISRRSFEHESLSAKQVHYESGPNMTPLVDVVMVILIFLMLAGSFGTNEHFMASSVPIHAKGSGKVDLPPGWVPPVLVDVQVAKNGDASIQPELSYEKDVKRVQSVLASKLEKLKQINGANSKVSIEVVLHPAPLTKWSALAPLYDAALLAKYEKVSFAQSN